MFDPASIATAVSLSTAAFNNIKKAFAIGRDLEGMSGDLSRWMKACLLYTSPSPRDDR